MEREPDVAHLTENVTADSVESSRRDVHGLDQQPKLPLLENVPTRREETPNLEFAAFTPKLALESTVKPRRLLAKLFVPCPSPRRTNANLFVSRLANAKEPDVASGPSSASTRNAPPSVRNVTGEDLQLVTTPNALANGNNGQKCANKDVAVANNALATENNALPRTLNAIGQERRLAHQRRPLDATGRPLVSLEDKNGVVTRPRRFAHSRDHW